MAALTLAEQPTASSETAAKRAIRAAVTQVAQRLGNTVAICRKCYIHPAVIEAYTKGTLTGRFTKKRAKVTGGLEPEERALLTLLRTGA